MIQSSNHPIVRSSTNGNVLFLILIAVGLFAALTYAVSGSFRGGDTTISKEQARIAAGEILRNMQAIKQGYDYLWNQQGCSIDDISFQSANGDIGATTFTDESDDGPATCEIFNIQGAGISYPNNLDNHQVAADAGTALGKYLFYFAGNDPGTYGIDSLGTAADDHMVILQAVNQEICYAVNRSLDYDNFSTDLIDAGDVIGDALAAFEGRTSGCRARASGGPYDIFYVLQDL